MRFCCSSINPFLGSLILLNYSIKVARFSDVIKDSPTSIASAPAALTFLASSELLIPLSETTIVFWPTRGAIPDVTLKSVSNDFKSRLFIPNNRGFNSCTLKNSSSE